MNATTTDAVFLFLTVIITAVNVGILGLCLKVYTEVVKDKNIDKRVKQQYDK